MEIRHPVFSVGIDGSGDVHAAFLNESRTRGGVQCSEAENPASGIFCWY
jgi:hypothetical protein